MASDQQTVDYICDQMRGAGSVSARKMFGEYAIYCAGKLVALVCDNQLFVKSTAGGKAMLDHAIESSPYPGAKPCLLLTDELDDADFVARLIAKTAHGLPPPKPKKTSAGHRVKK